MWHAKIIDGYNVCRSRQSAILFEKLQRFFSHGIFKDIYRDTPFTLFVIFLNVSDNKIPRTKGDSKHPQLERL